MKLVAEQVKYLRKRKRELEQKKREYVSYCTTRESAGFDAIGSPHYTDFQEEMENVSTRQELINIERALTKGEYVLDRNLSMIDIGTAFQADFGDDDPERIMLVEDSTVNPCNSIFASMESDLGNAAYGKHQGEEVSYVVKATGRTITMKIAEIDTVRENYEHFIKEKGCTNRISAATLRELKYLKENDPVEYRRRHAITPSQEELLKEEFGKICPTAKDPKSVARRGHIQKLLKNDVVVPNPEDDTIQVGSYVEVVLQDETGSRSSEFELINRAVSTEIDSDYVERISPMGQAIYGLREDDSFQVKRDHKPSIKGIVVSVVNDREKERVR